MRAKAWYLRGPSEAASPRRGRAARLVQALVERAADALARRGGAALTAQLRLVALAHALLEALYSVFDGCKEIAEEGGALRGTAAAAALFAAAAALFLRLGRIAFLRRE